MRPSNSCWLFGPYTLDPTERVLLRGDKPIHLTPKLFDTLLILVRNQGHLVDRETLIRAVWKDTFVEEGNLAHNVSVLRRTLGKNRYGHHYIETVPRHGYRFLSTEAGENQPRSSRSKPRFPRSERIRSIAVLPLENLSHDPRQEYFADGMTEALITGLAQIVPFKVISRTSSVRYKGSEKPLPQIGEELDVDAIVEGSVIRSKKRVRVTVQLLYAPKDRHLWAMTYDRALGDVLALQKELADAIAGEINVKLNSRARAASTTPRMNPTAYEIYLKGRYCWNLRTEEGLAKSVEHYTEAIRQDSGYALAYSGLADSYTLQASRRLGHMDASETMEKARLAANKAISLDQTLAEAHLSLAFVKFQHDWDWKGAENEFLRAIHLNPNSATSHSRYAMYLATMSRTKEATSEIDRAWDLDPLSPIIATAKGRLLHFQRKYDEAIEHHRRALAIEPDFVEAHFNLGMLYEQKGLFREAIAEFSRVIRVGGSAPFWLAGLAHAYGLAGMKTRATKILTDLEIKASHQTDVSPFDIAWVYLGLGDPDAALSWMERALGERCGPLVYQNIEPALDPLRPYPRFKNMLRRIGLPRLQSK
jgi:TolB-like protein/Flp pilus assembly protein TadD